jgi:hypothetical protein
MNDMWKYHMTRKLKRMISRVATLRLAKAIDPLSVSDSAKPCWRIGIDCPLRQQTNSIMSTCMVGGWMPETHSYECPIEVHVRLGEEYYQRMKAWQSRAGK